MRWYHYILCGYFSRDIFWIRVFWVFGIIAKDTRKNPLLFSERSGYAKYLRIGNWIVKGV